MASKLDLSNPTEAQIADAMTLKWLLMFTSLIVIQITSIIAAFAIKASNPPNPNYQKYIAHSFLLLAGFLPTAITSFKLGSWLVKSDWSQSRESGEELATLVERGLARANGPAASGGRPPANWWPDFTEELAVFIFEEGLPPGRDSEGQSYVIDAVFKRLAAAGKEEPSRSSVQGVTNAVLRRLRPANNP